jgi:peptide/nickel transport system substrate-binding protein
MFRVYTPALLIAACWVCLAAPSALVGQGAGQGNPPERKRSTIKEDEEATKPDTKPEARPDQARPALPTPEAEKPIEGIEKGPFNLVEEANNATNPAVKQFFTTFARPADVITFKSAQAGTKEIAVEPLPKRYERDNIANINYTTVEGRKGTFQHDQVIKVEPYEERVLAGVRKFLDSSPDRSESADGKPTLSRFQVLRAAEKVVTEALTFHNQAKQIKVRAGEGWDGYGADLERQLVQIQVGEIRALMADQDWPTAQALALRLFNERPGERELLAAIVSLHTGHATWYLDAKQDNFQARKVLEQLRNKYRLELPMDTRVERRLIDFARAKFEEGKKLFEDGKKTEAQKLFEEAAQAWPTLAGLDVYIKTSIQDYPVLRVGVRHLPTQFAPTTAASNIDQIASRLVFDPLLQIRYGPMQREGYTSRIGEEPRRVEQGWELEIPDYLKWNDGTPVTSADFLRSAELYSVLDKKIGSPVYDADAAEVLSVTAPDQRHVLFRFKRATVDPFAFLTFDLLPASRLPAGRSPRDQAFGKAPVGTGPFVFDKMEGEEMVFLANPHYQRPWATGGPAIREIRFIRFTDFAAARQALADGRWQMILDLTTAEKEELTGLPGIAVISPTSAENRTSTLPTTLENPRIYFLGFNYRKPAFQNPALRRAIGLAVDRTTILSKVFRGKGRPYHQILTGPFPLGSWAVPPDTRPLAYQGSEAARLMNDAKSATGLTSFTISYALEDLGAAQACEQIAADLSKLGVTVTPKGMPAAQLKADLDSENPSFDVVYAYYDFPNEQLSLWPLFDPSSATPGGRNFMGDCRDTELISIFRSMQNKRDLAFIQNRMHELYLKIWTGMHLAPLWQLDPHVAVHRSLQFTRIHPTYVFEDIEQWRLRKE